MYKPNYNKGGSYSSNNGNSGGSYNSSRSYGSSNNNYDRNSNGGSSYPPSNNNNRSNPNNMNSFDANLPKPVWSSTTMKPFEKVFYSEATSANRSQAEYNEFLNTNNVSVDGSRQPQPILNFADLDIPHGIMDKIRDAKYTKPTPIQSMCWPTLLSGHNMVGIAQTGSGKTFGFVLPLLIHISRNTRYARSINENRGSPGPFALVLAPTRELAIQIQQVAEEFGRLMDIRNVVIYGGASKLPQINQIKRGADIYIATPGRLLDFLKEEVITLGRCTYLVLDEADRMLDMGFEPQIRKIIEQIRPDRQTAMFSATWPKEVIKLAEDFISDYVHITIGATQLTANPNITQIVEICEENNKENRLREILKEIMNGKDSKAIIFAETKKRVDSYSKFMRDLGYHCLTIHGDKKQMEREWVLNEFKRKPRSILCATDVAARGINVADIKFVINVDYPVQTEDYIHRIGRTARSTNSGTSFTFITNDNARHMPKLIEVLKESNQYVSEDLYNLARMSGNGRGNMGHGRNNNFRSNNSNNNYNNGNKYSDNKPNHFNNNGYNNNNNGNHQNEFNANRKRDASNLNDTSDGSNENKRVRKFRWDEGPAVPVNNYPPPLLIDAKPIQATMQSIQPASMSGSSSSSTNSSSSNGQNYSNGNSNARSYPINEPVYNIPLPPSAPSAYAGYMPVPPPPAAAATNQLYNYPYY